MTHPGIDEFLQGCEAGSPLRLVTTPVWDGGPTGEATRWSLDTPFAVLGRAAGADVVLDDPDLRPRHWFLQVFGPKVLCIDLGSAGDPHPDGGRPSAGWIEPGKAVRVGRSLLIVDGEAGSPEGFLLRGPVPRVSLEIHSGQVKTRWAMRQTVALVGSAPECAARLIGPSISPFHCALVRTTTGLWAVDLLGGIDPEPRGGILVNGKPVRAARVGPDDRLQIGRFAISARYQRALGGASRGLRDLVRAKQAAAAQFPVVAPDRSSAALVERVRAEYRAWFDQLAFHQQVEVESLRREVEDLRRTVEGLEGRLSRARRSRRNVPPPGNGRADKRAPRRGTLRVLGSAVRRPLPDVSNAAESAGLPVGAVVGASLGASGLGHGDLGGSGSAQAALPAPSSAIKAVRRLLGQAGRRAGAPDAPEGDHGPFRSGFSAQNSSKKSAATTLPGERASGGVRRWMTAQSGSFGVWRALFRWS
jgi:hypothetical protein